MVTVAVCLPTGIEDMEEWTTSEEEEEEEEGEKRPEARSERREEEKRSQEKKERRKRRKDKMKKYNEEDEWEEDIQRLMASGIRNKLHTVELSRCEEYNENYVPEYLTVMCGSESPTLI